jgi:hypothetical protein
MFVLDVEPIADLVGLADLQGDARDDSAEQILSSKTEDDGGDSGAGQDAFELSLGMIPDAKDKEERDEVNKERDDLPEKMGNGRPPLSFPIQIPEVAIEKRDDEGGAEEEEEGADVVPPVGLDAVEPHRGVKSEGETEELEEDPERNAGAALEEPANAQRREKRRDENNNRHERFLRLDELQHQRLENNSGGAVGTSVGVSLSASFLLLIMIVLIIFGGIRASRKDQEQDHDQEQE